MASMYDELLEDVANQQGYAGTTAARVGLEKAGAMLSPREARAFQETPGDRSSQLHIRRLNKLLRDLAYGQ